ncbi:MAG: phosphoribosylamine--glycine ligase [Patescibacteria group bacterium]
MISSILTNPYLVVSCQQFFKKYSAIWRITRRYAMKPMKILVVGSGGREHAMIRQLLKSPLKPKVFCAPGNGGIGQDAEIVPIRADDIQTLLKFAQLLKIDLTIVGPEAPLVAGIVDEFQAAGLKIFGPTKAAAQLEGSKAFTKNLLLRLGIRTPAATICRSLGTLTRAMESRTLPMVIKADGLCGGKGVTVCQNERDLDEAWERIKADDSIVTALVEDFIAGEEVTVMALVDQNGGIKLLASSQDHKRLLDGDSGPNTGGMGAYSPAPIMTPALTERVMREIIRPTVKEMSARGNPFAGVLYAGLMIDAEGNPWVLEYNVRFGDPEAEVVLPRLKTDLLSVILAAVDGRLDQIPELEWDPRVALGVVMAAEGYPGKPKKGQLINGLKEAVDAGVIVNYAGVERHPDDLGFITAGGRVLCVTALGQSFAAAQKRAYAGVSQISWPGEHHRFYIGDRAVAWEKKQSA